MSQTYRPTGLLRICTSMPQSSWSDSAALKLEPSSARQAKSGMGKTAVFVLACLQQVDSSEKAGPGPGGPLGALKRSGGSRSKSGRAFGGRVGKWGGHPGFRVDAAGPVNSVVLQAPPVSFAEFLHCKK